MTRRILFYLPLNIALRVMAPVIAQLMRESPGRVTITVAFPAWPISKTVLQPRSEDVTRLFGQAVHCCALRQPEDLENLLRDCDVFVTQCPELAEIADPVARRLRQRSRACGVRWIALPYLFTQDHYPLLKPEFALDTWDLICTAGRASIRYVELATRSWAAQPRRELLDRFVVTGYTALDGIRELSPAAAIRERYDLPDAPVICIGTAPSLYPLNSSSHCVRGLHARFRGLADWSARGVASRLISYRYPWMIDYRTYLSAVRRLADAHGAVVVAKSRVKHQDPPYLDDYVDRVVGDESFFPTSALEILSISQLYFGFLSSMAVEAIALNIYAITAVFQPPEQIEQPAWTSWNAHFYRRPGSVWNIPGVSESFLGIGLAARRGLRKLEGIALGAVQIDEEQRLRFLTDYFNWPCHASTEIAALLMDEGQCRAAASLS